MTALQDLDYRQSRDYGKVDVLSRDEFLDEFESNFASGQHVTALGPTQRGKTTLVIQMLDRVASPDRPARLLAGKPPGRDDVMAGAAEKLNLEIVEEWPPPTTIKSRAQKLRDKFAEDDNELPKRGHVLRPKQTLVDEKADSANVAKHFKNCMGESYASATNVIVVADEGHHVENEYGCKSKCDAIHMRGAPVVSLFELIQRGRFISYHAYNSAEWVLAAHDPDKSNTDRYSDIGGVDPHYLKLVLRSLQTKTITNTRGEPSTISEFVCMRRSGSQIYIVAMQ